jgi:hypothetical protein
MKLKRNLFLGLSIGLSLGLVLGAAALHARLLDRAHYYEGPGLKCRRLPSNNRRF